MVPFMEADRIARLTEAQREVLRRWQVRRSAKEIAIELGITHWAVNERLRAARRTLGAGSSQEAAQMLARAEAGETYKHVVYEPQGIAGVGPPGMVGASEDAGGWASRPVREDAVHEEQVPFRVTEPIWQGPRLPLPRFEGDRNDLTPVGRLMWIGAAAFAVIVAVGTLITISAGVSNTVDAIVRALS